MRSAPEPEKNTQPLKIVVGSNFDDLVINNDNNVLLMAYSPNCGHCKKLKFVFKKLAYILKYTEITVAKINAITNEHKLLRLNEYPTIFFF